MSWKKAPPQKQLGHCLPPPNFLKLERKRKCQKRQSVARFIKPLTHLSILHRLFLSRTLRVKRPAISTFTPSENLSVRHKWGSEKFRGVSGNLRNLIIKSPNLTLRFLRLAVKDSFGAHAIMDGQDRESENWKPTPHTWKPVLMPHATNFAR